MYYPPRSVENSFGEYNEFDSGILVKRDKVPYVLMKAFCNEHISAKCLTYIVSNEVLITVSDVENSNYDMFKDILPLYIIAQLLHLNTIVYEKFIDICDTRTITVEEVTLAIEKVRSVAEAEVLGAKYSNLLSTYIKDYPEALSEEVIDINDKISYILIDEKDALLAKLQIAASILDIVAQPEEIVPGEGLIHQ